MNRVVFLFGKFVFRSELHAFLEGNLTHFRVHRPVTPF